MQNLVGEHVHLRRRALQSSYVLSVLIPVLFSVPVASAEDAMFRTIRAGGHSNEDSNGSPPSLSEETMPQTMGSVQVPERGAPVPVPTFLQFAPSSIQSSQSSFPVLPPSSGSSSSSSMMAGTSTTPILLNGESHEPDIGIGANGRYFVAFSTKATNLHLSDLNTKYDVYRWDVSNFIFDLMSFNSSFIASNGDSFSPRITTDGSRSSFYNYSTDLLNNGTTTPDSFLWDSAFGGSVTQVSMTPNQMQPTGSSTFADIDPSGRYTIYDTTALSTIVPPATGSGFVMYDAQLGTNTLLTPGFGGYISSSNGAANVAFDDRYRINGCSTSPPYFTFPQVYLLNRSTGVITFVSRPAGGGCPTYFAQKPSISSDGVWLVFESGSMNLIAGDTNGKVDIFLYNTVTAQLTMLAVPAIGGGQLNGHSTNPSISPDGRYIAFESQASNIVSQNLMGFANIYLFDRLTNQVRLVSQAAYNPPTNSVSVNPEVMYNAVTQECAVTYESPATNLVQGPQNGLSQIYMTFLPCGPPYVVMPRPAGPTSAFSGVIQAGP